MLRTFNRIYQCSLLLMVVGLCAGLALAQNTFNSGSTGANGAFSPTSLPTGCTRSGSSITCDLPPNGIFNFTTFDLPSGNTLRFNRNARNTPAIILASGNCALGGYIDISGENGSTSNGFGLRPRGGRGWVGGFDGGGGGRIADLYRNGVNGDGPGGGGGGKENGAARGGGGGGANFLAGGAGASSVAALAGAAGRPYGSFSLPVIGGSGGGGAPANGTISNGYDGAGGGGGGGAILIACSGTMTINGLGIDAYGGRGTYQSSVASGGGGGGGIRLIATAITGASATNRSASFDVRGGDGGQPNNTENGGNGGAGFVRIEAFNFSNFIPQIYPDANLGIYFQGTPPPSLNLGASPTLRITTVAGVNVPTDPKGTFGNTPDIPFTAAPANPVTLGIAAANIPLGTRATIILTPETGAITTVQSTPLAGTVAASTATASVTLPQGRSLLNAIVTIEANAQMAGLAPEFIQGERVKQIKIAAQLGGASEIVYVTESGKEIRAKSE